MYREWRRFGGLGAPTLNVSIAASDDSVFLAWTNITGNIGYEVYASTTESGIYSLVGTTLTDVNSGTFSGFGANAVRYFKVRAIGPTAGLYSPLSNALYGFTFDTDAWNYMVAAGITDYTEQTIVNGLVTDLKAYSFWTSFDRLWLMSPTDATAASVCVVSLTSFTYANTFGSDFCDCNIEGLTATDQFDYIDTEFAPSSTGIGSSDNYTVGVGNFLKFAGADSGYLWGVNDGSETTQDLLIYSSGVDHLGTMFQGGITTSASLLNETDANHYSLMRDGSKTLQYYKNGNLAASNGAAQVSALPTYDLFINGVNDQDVAVINWTNFDMDIKPTYQFAYCGYFSSSGFTPFNLDNALRLYSTSLRGF